MNQEDRSEKPSTDIIPGPSQSSQCALAEQAPAKARYEQSFPASSHRSIGTSPFSFSPTPRSVLDVLERSHATTSIGDVVSTYSYDSTRDSSAYFREINGRVFSNQASPYMLPADEPEFWRLDKQHAAFLVGLGDLYPCPDLVERVLAPKAGDTVEMIDLGCGTGTWTLSMARRFPHVQVVGLDMVPTPLNPEQLTPNIRFEIDDINLGLQHYAGRFNLVHMRCVGGGLPNYAQAITYAAQCVRPGGLLIVVDADMQICAEDMVSYQRMATPNQPNGSWLQRFLYEFRWAYAANGADLFQAEEMLDSGLWDHPLVGTCGAGSVYLPIGPWATATDPEENQRLQFGGVLKRQHLKNGLHSFQTVMKRNGVPQGQLDEWVQNCERELDSLSQHSWKRLRMLWGERNNVDTPPTSRPVLGDGSTLGDSTWVPHKQVHLYRNAEECQNARKRRLDTIGEIVEPLVLSPA